MNYRLLNEGEVIQKRDEYQSNAINFRRPITNESQWVSISERKPTKEDASPKGDLLFRYANGVVNSLSWDFPSTGTHWCRIPAFTEPDPFEEWKKAADVGNTYCLGLKDAFNAGREYEREKK